MNTVKKYRKKPVVIEAIQFTEDSWREIEDWSDNKAQLGKRQKGESLCLLVSTLEDCMRAELGDYIIKGIKGEFYPCKPDIFEATYSPVDKKYKVITLCGSTKFKDEFLKQQARLTLAGHIVISVGVFGHTDGMPSDEQKIMLDDIHKYKIDMADEVFVINVDGYIGSSTRSEINYAVEKGKEVLFSHPQFATHNKRDK